MSNRVISNTAGLPDIFTPPNHPRYRAFNETQYAFMPVPFSCNSNYTCFHGIINMFFFELYAFIILTSTLVLGINYFVIITRVLVDQHSHNRPQHFPCR